MRSVMHGALLWLTLCLLLLAAPTAAQAKTNRWSPAVAARLDKYWGLFLELGTTYKIAPDEMAAICIQESTLLLDVESKGNFGPCQVNWYLHSKMLCKEKIACSAQELKSEAGIKAGFRVYKEMKRIWPWAVPCTYKGAKKGCQYGKDVQEIRALVKERHP